MAKVPVAVRLDPAVVEWYDGYAVERTELARASGEIGPKERITRQVLLESAVDEFAEMCMRGVPSLRAAVRRQSYSRDEAVGVGDCPRRGDGLGHVFRSPDEDPSRPCRFCGLGGRASRPVSAKPAAVPAPGFLDVASQERASVFSRLHVPMVSGSGKPPSSREA